MEWLTPEAQREQKSAVFPRFYTKAVQHKGKSDEAGRPIFIEQEYVEIRIAGDNKNIVNRKVSQRDIDRWPKLYEQFKGNQEQTMEGTPVKEWMSLSTTRALELQAINIHTVEQLSEVPDSSLHMIGMDGRELKTKAIAYLKASKEAGYSEKLALQNQALKDDVEFLKGKMGPLIDKLDELTNEINSLKGKDNVAEPDQSNAGVG